MSAALRHVEGLVAHQLPHGVQIHPIHHRVARDRALRDLYNRKLIFKETYERENQKAVREVGE